MKKRLIAAAVLAVIGTSAFAQADPSKGGSSGSDVVVGVSNFPSLPIIAPDGYAALSMRRNDGSFSGFIPLRAPVALASAVATANTAGPYYAYNPLTLSQAAQVWRTDTSYNAAAETFSLRQTDYPTAANWPHFGGLVIGRVAGTGATNGVYFGEWSPAETGGPLPSPSTDLNMDSAGRTVWYVGDNPVTSTPTLSNVTYNVVGIRQTGVGSNLPYAPNLYSGVLTANYVAGGGSNTLAGNLSRTGDTTVAINATINSTGQFTGAGVQGRFYNNAAALAGIYTGGGTAATNIAFGGSRSN